MIPLRNAEKPERIPTYEGSGQATHPSVVKFEHAWNGYEYWMAMTPYPYNNGGYEDPSVIASHDGRKWEVPPGVTNPLAPAPETGHNCDVELVYVKEKNELWLYYVEADDVKQSWVKLMRSGDGIHWSSPETVVWDPDHMYSILSPAIVRLEDGSWKMWYVNTGNTGYINQNNKVCTRCSGDGIYWGQEEICGQLSQPGYQIWHISVWREPETGIFHALYPAYPNGTDCDYCSLFYALQEPGKPWTTFQTPVLVSGQPGAWDDFCIYRSSFLLEREKNIWKLWYGGKKKSDASWNIGFAEIPYNQLIEELTQEGGSME